MACQQYVYNFIYSDNGFHKWWISIMDFGFWSFRFVAYVQYQNINQGTCEILVESRLSNWSIVNKFMHFSAQKFKNIFFCCTNFLFKVRCVCEFRSFLWKLIPNLLFIIAQFVNKIVRIRKRRKATRRMKIAVEIHDLKPVNQSANKFGNDRSKNNSSLCVLWTWAHTPCLKWLIIISYEQWNKIRRQNKREKKSKKRFKSKKRDGQCQFGYITTYHWSLRKMDRKPNTRTFRASFRLRTLFSFQFNFGF